MDWKRLTEVQPNTYQVPKRWLKPHYYEALNILFRFENALRLFVYAILKTHLKENWKNASVSVDGSETQSTIASVAKTRLQQSKGFAYLGYPISCPMMFLNGGELIQIIVSDAYWKHFAEFFPGKREVIKNKFEEISQVRNALAHFRPLQVDDVGVVTQNAKQVLLSVEKYLNQLLSTHNQVPTNTSDRWYSDLRTKGTDICSLKFFQSDDEKWIRIHFTYNSPILEVSEYPDWKFIRLLTIDSSKLFDTAPELQAEVIAVVDHGGSVKIDNGEVRSAVKHFSFLFWRESLNHSCEAIKNGVEAILAKISEETEFIKQDNLARGKIVQGVSVTASMGEKGRWTSSTESLGCTVKENDPAEYWGRGMMIAEDFVARTKTYPWMPVEIADTDWFE